MLDNVRFSDLQTFSLVVRHGGFSAAARASGQPQTTLSKRLSTLEEALGVRLLHRSTRRIGLTDDGRRVYEWALKILGDAEEMGNELNTADGLRGPLRVSASSRLGRAYVAPVLDRMKNAHPDLDVWLEIVDRRVDLLAEGLHLDVRAGEPQEPHLIKHRILESSRILCASPSYIARCGAPSSLVDVRRHRCILFRDRNEPLGVWRLKGPKGWESVDIHSELASNDNEVVLSWAQQGQGIMLGTDWFFAQSLQDRSLVRVLPGWREPADVWAVSASRMTQSAKVRAFVQDLREEMQARHGRQAR